jgi:hypothetical protein
MKTLHLYPADDPLIAAHVALLQEGEEPFSGQPDIVHVHGCWRYNIVRQAMRAHRQGARIVMTPHNGLSPWIVSERRMTEKLSKTLLWQRRMVESAYVIIAQGPMESEALTQLGWNPRIETIRNAVVTNSITPEATRRHTLEVYRKVLDSNTIELMSDDSRRLMTMLLKAGITGDRRWVAGEAPDISETEWRRLLVYADHENVRTVIDRGTHVMGLRAPYIETAQIKSYLPTDYQLPKVDNHTVEGIVSEMHHGPLTLRQIVELDRALRRPDADDERMVDELTEKRLIRYFRHVLQLLKEVTLLDEGFMPVDAIDDKQTEKLRRQLLAHLRI